MRQHTLWTGRGLPCLSAVLLAALILTGCDGAPFSVSPPPQDYVAVEDGFRYYKTYLTPQEQYLYDQLLAGLRDQEETVGPLYPDDEMIQAAAQAIERDYPEFFWFSGTGQVETTLLAGTPIKAVYRPTYTMDAQQRQTNQQAIDQWTSACFATLPPNPSDHDKMLTVFTYIIDHADYQTVEANSIVNIMVDGKGLCGCYAKTTQYLLNRLGVNCTYVSGQAGGEAHAWNLVWPDGTPCWVDTTWGDPVSDTGSSNRGPAYEFFGLTTADLLRTHTIDDTVPVPQCVSEEYNYYHRNRLYFTSYDPDALTSAVKNAISSGDATVSLRFSDQAYPTACAALLEQGQLHTLFRRAEQALSVNLGLGNSLWYTRNDEMGTLTITMPQG